MKKIYEFFWDCGRMGELEGVFIADSDLVDELIGETVNFGEVLGKHSDIYGDLDQNDLTVRSEDQEAISVFQEIMGEGWSSGHNPIEAIMEQMAEDEDQEDRYERLKELL